MPRLSATATASAKASFRGTEKITKNSVTRIDAMNLASAVNMRS